MAKNDTKSSNDKAADKPLDDKAYEEFAKTDEGKAAEENKVAEPAAEAKEPEPHPLVAAAAQAQVGDVPGRAEANPDKGTPAPVQPPPMMPADGWLASKQYVLCWVRAEKGKVVEIQPASEYEATHVETGTGEPHDVLVDSGKEVALQKK
jgi:hypothetical protein